MPGPGRKFVVGDPRINREGRALGATDRKWMDIKWWFSHVEANIDKMLPHQRVEAGLRGMAMLLAKMPQLPSTPQESVKRVEDARIELLEACQNEIVKSGSDPTSVGNSLPEIQARTETKTSL